MEKQPAAQSSPGAADKPEADGGEPRPSLRRARLAFVAALALLIGAGTGQVSAFIWFLIAEVRGYSSNTADIVFYGAFTLPPMAASLLGLLAVLSSHLRGMPLGAGWIASAAVVIVISAIPVALLGLGATAPFSLFAVIGAVAAIYLLYADTGRGQWRGGMALAVALLIGSAAVALNLTASNSFSVSGLVLLGSMLIISSILQPAIWLLLPLTLMASDSYLLLRQRRGQEEQAAAP